MDANPLSIQTPIATAAIVRTSGEAGGRSQSRDQRRRRGNVRREAIAELLQERGIVAPDEMEAAVQLVQDRASGAMRVRVINLRDGALLAEVDADEFAQAAQAHQAFEGLLVERSS